jgi:hypothetical protein
MGAKFTVNWLNPFLDVWRRFLRHWLKSLKKVLVWPKKNCLEKNQKRYQKTQNFMLISNPLKKFFKNAQKKSYKQNKFDKHE